MPVRVGSSEGLGVIASVAVAEEVFDTIEVCCDYASLAKMEGACEDVSATALPHDLTAAGEAGDLKLAVRNECARRGVKVNAKASGVIDA